MTDDEIRQVQEAIRQNPKNAAAYSRLAEIYEKQDEKELAYHYYEKSNQLFPNTQTKYALHMLKKGEFSEKEQQLEKEIFKFEQMIKEQPDNSYAYRFLAEIYEHIGKI